MAKTHVLVDAQMDIHVQCPRLLDRDNLERVLRETVSSALAAQTDIVFKYTESPDQKTVISLPQMNGELKVSDFELATAVYKKLCLLIPHGPIECGIRGTRNGLSRW